ncbi:MAG: hypothetical protein KAJ76_00045 [Candidatus Heimdallarchaeota archaeon]|nr:hypothetical protein [Candidatus Heimdallarchaeota archaeon]MCK5297261.1 hypothetical protein [Candidatus Heimdallarchaeota archaeon]
MSSEDDVFLKTFTQMIEVLTKIDTTLDSLKKTVESIHLSIDGLGTGITNINSQLTNLGNKVETLSTKIQKMPKQPAAEKVVKEKIKVAKEKGKPSTKEVIADAAQHPIFVDLTKKINAAEKFKEAGEILIEALEQIESSFSFSRVFYEIRRIGNGFIRKGDNEFQASDKQDLLEKAVDWETRLSA